MSKIELGQKVRDIVTGLEGIAVSRVEYLNGCVQYGIRPRISNLKDKPMEDAHYVDQTQIEVVSGGVKAKLTKLAEPKKRARPRTRPRRPPGGPSRDVPPSSYRGD